jgi:hypothetical protein
MGIKVKDLEANTIYYDANYNEIVLLENIVPTWGDNGLFLIFSTKEGKQFQCLPFEVNCASFIKIGKL